MLGRGSCAIQQSNVQSGWSVPFAILYLDSVLLLSLVLEVSATCFPHDGRDSQIESPGHRCWVIPFLRILRAFHDVSLVTPHIDIIRKSCYIQV